MASVSLHAAERYIERVEPFCTVSEATDRITASARAIDTAAAFGCNCVIHPTGAKLVLVGDRVVTVLAKRQFVRNNLPGSSL